MGKSLELGIWTGSHILLYCSTWTLYTTYLIHSVTLAFIEALFCVIAFYLTLTLWWWRCWTANLHKLEQFLNNADSMMITSNSCVYIHVIWMCCHFAKVLKKTQTVKRKVTGQRLSGATQKPPRPKMQWTRHCWNTSITSITVHSEACFASSCKGAD